MRFKQFLEDVRRDLYSWLSPDGKFYPVPSQGHDYAAYKILKGEVEPYIALHTLMQRNWLRVTFYARNLVAHNEESKMINSIQRRALIDLAIQNNMESIDFDNGHREINLWNKGD